MLNRHSTGVAPRAAGLPRFRRLAALLLVGAGCAGSPASTPAAEAEAPQVRKPQPAPAVARDAGPAELQNPAWPAWARVIRFVPQDGKPGQVINNSRFAAADMKESVGRLRHVIDAFPRAPEHPFYLFQQGRHCLELDQDALAHRHFKRLLDLPPNTPFKATGEHPTLASMARDSRFMLARIYARLGLKAEALAELQALPVQSGYDAVRHADILVRLDDAPAAAAMLAKSQGAGHPDRGFSDLMIRLRAATLARGLGRNDLVRQIAAPIVKNGVDAQKWPQWKSACSILLELDRLAAAAKPDANPNSGQPRKDGVFTDSCRGFDQLIDVEVRVTGGRLTSVKALKQKESRPWSALEAIPGRILKRQSLAVDAVTGATVTSCAIVTAADKALQK